MAKRTTIYRSAAHQSELMGIYDDLLARWPAPYRLRTVPTRYGRVSVIESGPEDGQPVLLLHASSTAAVSWGPNIAALADRYRLLAVDHIGEAGRSTLNDIRVFPKGKDQLAALYAQVADGLGVDRAHVVGASNGGFVAMCYASRHPERVLSLSLLGPMGLTRLRLGAALRMMFVSMFPSPRRAERTAAWAIGSSPLVATQCGDWFDAVLLGIASPPSVAAPGVMTEEELAALPMPALVFLGTKDNLVGPASRAERSARRIPSVDVRIVASGHLVNVECAEQVNEVLPGFLAAAGDAPMS
jgi:pimeloyl-ACP methyl ester carboxylesterase